MMKSETTTTGIAAPVPPGWRSWDHVISEYDRAVREAVKWKMREAELRKLLQDGCDACTPPEPAREGR